MTDRKEIIAKLNQIVEEKIRQFQALIDDLRSSNTETKSSMGDKYETSREMLQQEIMQIQRQLAVFQEHQSHVRRLTDISSEIIRTGSIVKTTFGNFLIITSLGEFQIEGEKFVSISEQTPLAQQLLGKKTGDSFSIQQRAYQILEVD
ncbi:GreA/GreB family elongation factor [Moheibacter sediminis]|uniref:Transcription elongation factor, GreA/GreB, C-term n=1 Tax=Moheibacter sediminis TaxID=1434700 RepID=A0A1W2AF36_9FLAO|nr:GreA/GreB family elongation factor [Moheibacter sediminis]SMC59244.1 Transcription elongation factor, GreA/GreB, C-term [Moheibacter sediminis]